MKNKQYQVVFTDEEWQKKLTPEQYQILRKKGTERPLRANSILFSSPAFIPVPAVVPRFLMHNPNLIPDAVGRLLINL